MVQSFSIDLLFLASTFCAWLGGGGRGGQISLAGVCQGLVIWFYSVWGAAGIVWDLGLGFVLAGDWLVGELDTDWLGGWL